MNADIYDTIQAMHTYGGSFVQALASAWEVADHNNRLTLESSFADMFDKYRQMAEVAA